MKILLINHFPLTGSGSGVYNANIANSLIRKGHEVKIIVPENTEVFDDMIHPVYFTGEKEISGSLPFNFPCFTTHPRSTQTFYELTKSQFDMYKNAFLSAIEEEIFKFKPDVIHASHIWILADLAASFDIPLVITAHGTDLIGYRKGAEFRTLANRAVAKAYKIVTISEDNEKLVLETFKGIEDKTLLMKNGYDPNVFYPEEYDKNEVLKELGINKKYNKVVSFAGKFTKFKGIDLLLKAAKIYQRDDAITLICGNGELFKEMNLLAKELDLKNVVFLGNQPHDVLRKIYNIADVSLIPSRNEAFGLVVIEAMACGAPVIGTNQGGIPEIITPEVGMVFEPENYQELAEKIKLIINDKVVFDRKRNANYAYSTYSEDKLIEQLIKVYEDAINMK